MRSDIATHEASKEGGVNGTAIAQWIRLRLPSCHPGVESKVYHLCFYQFYQLCHVEKTNINEKEAGIGPIFIKRRGIIWDQKGYL